MVCTFFGHSIVAKEIEPILQSTLIDLIENYDVKIFYVGNHGGFDGMVRRVLNDLSEKYDIVYRVVLAYIPTKKYDFENFDYKYTILPNGIETVPKRFAINYRNKWMIKKSDYVVTYVPGCISSGAEQFARLAERQQKRIINLA